MICEIGLLVCIPAFAPSVHRHAHRLLKCQVPGWGGAAIGPTVAGAETAGAVAGGGWLRDQRARQGCPHQPARGMDGRPKFLMLNSNLFSS